jgi:hypothetical protein
MPILLPPKQTAMGRAKAVRARERKTFPAIDWLDFGRFRSGCALSFWRASPTSWGTTISAPPSSWSGPPRSLHSSRAPTGRPTSKPSLRPSSFVARNIRAALAVIGPDFFYKPGLRPNTQRRDPSGRRHIVT